MASRYLADVNGISQFDCTESSNLGPRWTKWLRAFELFADGKGIKDKAQKRALLLHTAGMGVQDIYFTLTEVTPEEDDNPYTITVKTLNAYMTPHTNYQYERHLFRNMVQLPNESVIQYITRLQDKASSCDFSDSKKEIIGQVIDKTHTKEMKYNTGSLDQIL